MIDPDSVEGFDWDTGNARKNDKHEVSQTETEEVFSINRYWCWQMLNTVRMSCDFMRWVKPMQDAGCTSHSRSAPGARWFV